jgi:hypothetical protein
VIMQVEPDFRRQSSGRIYSMRTGARANRASTALARRAQCTTLVCRHAFVSLPGGGDR